MTASPRSSARSTARPSAAIRGGRPSALDRRRGSAGTDGRGVASAVDGPDASGGGGAPDAAHRVESRDATDRPGAGAAWRRERRLRATLDALLLVLASIPAGQFLMGAFSWWLPSASPARQWAALIASTLLVAAVAALVGRVPADRIRRGARGPVGHGSSLRGQADRPGRPEAGAVTRELPSRP